MEPEFMLGIFFMGNALLENDNEALLHMPTMYEYKALMNFNMP